MDRGSKEDNPAFFRSAYDRFLEAGSSSGQIDFYYRIFDTTVRLSFAGEELIPHITPALSHLRLAQDAAADFTICLWDSRSTRTKMVPPPWNRDRFTNRGDIWNYFDSRIKAAFHGAECSLNMLDLETMIGLYWMEHAEGLPFWVNASPIRTLLQWCMERRGGQLIHAAAVGTKDGAVLLTGKGGIGKSSTALSCLKSGFFYIGDDFVVTRLKPSPLALSIYSTAKLNPDQMENFPDFAPLISNGSSLGREKAVMFLHPEFKDQIAGAMPLKAILVPHITGIDKSRITETSHERAYRASSFTTLTLLPGASIATDKFLSRFSMSLPCFNLELGRDLDQIPHVISDLLYDLSKANMSAGVNTGYVERRGVSGALPFLSVIVPAFNGEQFIREAIENIIAQDYPSLEIIVVDDGSEDNTAEIIKQLPYEVRYLYQPNGGPAGARNTGIREAKGEYIAFLDVDDLWPVNNLYTLVEEISRNDEAEAVLGHGQIANYNPSTDTYEYSGSPAGEFPYYVGAALYRRSVFSKVGLFDPTLRYGEDTDWFMRARELGIVVRKLEEITLVVRRHGNNMTLNRDPRELNQLRVLKKSVDRLRARRKEAQ